MARTASSNRSPQRKTDHLVTAVSEMRGVDVSYSTGGRGLPVLFLHGWGLDHRAYRRPLKQLTSRNCRVVAPTLPGFGGTAGLAVNDRSLEAYGTWVADLLDHLDIDGPMVVIGHSFGGGVATMLARDHPDRVSHLVLLNSVGDARSFWAGWRPRAVRPIDPLGIRRSAELFLPTSAGVASRRNVRSFTENVIRGPMTLLQTASTALTTDLRDELADLSARSLPIMVLWSDRDTVIPFDAFGTFCQAVGVDGHVVAGGHSWLLSAPDSFGQVLSNLVSLESNRHRCAVAGATVEEIRALLGRTAMSKRRVADLLAGLDPLWLLSAPAKVLAADLALADPRLKADEVRVVVRPLEDSERYRLTVLANDRHGLLAHTAAMVAAEGFSVEAASVQTWTGTNEAMHALTIQPPADTVVKDLDEALRRLGARLSDGGPGLQPMEGAEPSAPTGEALVRLRGSAGDTSVVQITATDRIGLLSDVCRWFAEHGVTVESAGVNTAHGRADDVFVVRGAFDHEGLRDHLSGPVARGGGLGDMIRRTLVPSAFGDLLIEHDPVGE